MFDKNYLKPLIASIIINLLLGVYVLFLNIYPHTYKANIHGTYKSTNNSSIEIITFDSDKKEYYFYSNGDLVKNNLYETSVVDNIYLLKNDPIDTYIILNNDSFYLILDKDNIYLFNKTSNALTFYGEKP